MRFLTAVILLAVSPIFANSQPVQKPDPGAKDCTVRFAHRAGAFMTCNEGRFMGYLGWNNSFYSGRIVCRKDIDSCISDFPVSLDPRDSQGPRPIAQGELLFCSWSVSSLACKLAERTPELAKRFLQKVSCAAHNRTEIIGVSFFITCEGGRITGIVNELDGDYDGTIWCQNDFDLCGLSAERFTIIKTQVPLQNGQQLRCRVEPNESYWRRWFCVN